MEPDSATAGIDLVTGRERARLERSAVSQPAALNQSIEIIYILKAPAFTERGVRQRPLAPGDALDKVPARPELHAKALLTPKRHCRGDKGQDSGRSVRWHGSMVARHVG